MFWKRGEPRENPEVTDAEKRDTMLHCTGKLMIGLTASPIGGKCWITSKAIEQPQNIAEWESQRQGAPIKSIKLKWRDAEENEGQLHATINKQTKHWDIEWTNCDGTERKEEMVSAMHIPLGEAVTITSVEVARAKAKARGGRGGAED